jgi:hypothetical protein
MKNMKKFKIEDPFKYTEKDLYRLMKEIGDKRFGSECKHKHVKNHKCLDCFRTVK